MFDILNFMIKACLFDYGGVITPGGSGHELSERLATALDISPEEGYLLLGSVWDEYARGKITESDIWRSIETRHDKAIEVGKRAIWNTWAEHMQPLPEMLGLVDGLKQRGCTVGLLSNVIPNTAADIQNHGGYDAFDFVVLSCQVGVSKPDLEIYKMALKKLPGTKPEEVVFIDDQERCLVPARDLGINTVLAVSPRQISDDIYRLINTIK